MWSRVEIARPRVAAQATLLVAASALAILLSPLPPAFQRDMICAEVRPIGARAHMLVNCDAGTFLELARNPLSALEPNSVRQTRPGYGVLGWIAASPFRIVSAAIAHPPIAALVGRRSFDPFYAGYVLVNALLLILSAMLLADLLGVSSLLAPAAVVPMAILLVNHVTKAFFWSPHVQVFGLFSSMLTIWLARWVIVSRRGVAAGWTFLAGVCVGLASLIYGVFLLMPLTLTAAIWFLRRAGHPYRKALHSTLLWVGVIAPIAAWRAYVVDTTGTFYSHETEYYHEFVWIGQALAAGPDLFLRDLLKNVGSFFRTMPYALGLPVAFLGAAAALAVSRARAFPVKVFAEPPVQAAVANLVAACVFYVLLGFYDPRLTATLAVPLIVVGGRVSRAAFTRATDERHPIFLPEPVTIAAVAYVAIVILVRGPYA